MAIDDFSTNNFTVHATVRHVASFTDARAIAGSEPRDDRVSFAEAFARGWCLTLHEVLPAFEKFPQNWMGLMR